MNSVYAVKSHIAAMLNVKACPSAALEGWSDLF